MILHFGNVSRDWSWAVAHWVPVAHWSFFPIPPYSDKRKQLSKMMFLINEQNVSVMYIDINAVSLCLDLNIFQQDECFCSNLVLEVEYSKSNVKISLSQIWVICQLLPFVRVGQYSTYKGKPPESNQVVCAMLRMKIKEWSSLSLLGEIPKVHVISNCIF